MRPNRIYIIILAALLFSLCNSCKDTGPINYQNSVITLKPQNLSISTNEIFFNTPQASTSTFQVNSTNIEWEITGIPDWMTISPTSGSDNTTVTVTVTENALTSNRMGIVSFSSTDDSWSYSSPLTISQYRATCYATPETNQIEFDGSATTASIKIDSNIEDWSVNKGTSMNWCTVSKGDNCINISVTPNSGWTARSGQIEISTTDGTEYITIMQRSDKISLTTDHIDFTVMGGIITFEINYEAPWEAHTLCSWINVTPTSGPAGNNTLSVEVTPNYSSTPRNDYIYLILSDDNKIEIPVCQEPIIFAVDNIELSTVASGGTETVMIESNTSWHVEYVPSWIEVTPSSGTGNGQVLITVSNYTEIAERTGVIIITPDVIDYPERIIMKQAGLLGSDSTSMHFTDKANSLYLSIYTELDWTALPSDSWITLDANSGSGNAQIKVSVTENTADTVRTGYVTVMADGKQIKISVIQQGKYLNVSSSALDFTSRGGSTQVTLKSNDSWTATASDSWITLSATNGNGDCNLTITVQDNTSSVVRNGYVDIIPNDSKPVRITISQAIRYLKVSTSTLHIPPSGGTSKSITITTDGVAKITTDVSWLTINEESDTRFTVTASKNEGLSDRSAQITISLTDMVALVTPFVIISVNQYHSHDYVDLGLSVKWATCNVGADKPENYGDYYAWGEIETKSDYSLSTYKYCNGELNKITKYCNISFFGNNGFTDNKTKLDLNDDVAHVKWGDNWRMPTKAEFEELLSNCTWTWSQQNGVTGYIVTSNKTGYTNRSIFLPATGYRVDTSLIQDGAWGSYFSSSLSTDYPSDAYACQIGLNSNLTIQVTMQANGRMSGLPVRPVCP